VFEEIERRSVRTARAVEINAVEVNEWLVAVVIVADGTRISHEDGLGSTLVDPAVGGAITHQTQLFELSWGSYSVQLHVVVVHVISFRMCSDHSSLPFGGGRLVGGWEISRINRRFRSGSDRSRRRRCRTRQEPRHRCRNVQGT